MFSRALLSLAAVWLISSWTAEARAQDQLFSRFRVRGVLEVGLVDDLQDGSLDGHSLIQASLIAAGHVDDARIQAVSVRYRNYLANCGERLSDQAGIRNQAAAIFRFMHEEILRGRFEADLYDLARTITDGDYNCLTATILFQSLCQSFSLPARALWQPAHVRCWLAETEYEGRAVETTTTQWNDALSACQPLADIPGRLLTQTELVAKVFYNRGVEAMHGGWYATALLATCASCILDADDDQAQCNLRACLNNWALEAAATGDLETARSLLETGIEFDPEYRPFFLNQAFLQRMSQGT